VKHWQETGQILDRLVRFGREGRPSALATVTRIAGSAYRRPGAKLLIADDGGLLGGVSGGCLEEDVRQVGLEVLRSGRSRLRRYQTGDDETKLWGLGLGCDGEVDVLVQPVAPQTAVGAWAAVRDLLRGDSPFALATLLDDGGVGDVLAVGEAGRVAGRFADPGDDSEVEAAAAAALRARRTGRQVVRGRAIFSEVLLPPPRLLVCGAGEDARPLVRFASGAGFRAFVADHRSAYLTAERFPEALELFLLRPDEAAAELPMDRETYAVVMTHSLERDTDWVRRLAAADARYIGVLGPRARTARILEQLRLADSERFFGPVGLDLGADGPEQVALSVVAELLSVRSGREPRHLRERLVAVHEAP